MTFDFTGKRIVVAGGSCGIGRSIALGFAAAGAAVSICARGADSLAATRGELAKSGGAAHAASCDLADGAAITRYIAEAAASLGGIDVLVNNASGFGASDDEAGWAAAVGVDLMATLRASWTALPWLEQSPHASLIHITSTVAFKPSVLAPAYSAIKAALVHYTKSQ